MFRTAAWTGVLVLVVAVGLVLILPARMGPLPDGMRTPILAFELARSADEVETMFGPPGQPERAAWRRAMDLGNYTDFAFMLAYGLFFALFSRALVASGSRAAALGVRVAPVAVIMDVLENLQLLAITRALGADYADALARLQLLTWLKWFAVGAVYVSWIPGMSARGPLGKVGASLASLSALATLIAVVVRGNAAELMGHFGALTVLVALTLAFRAPK